MKKNIIILIAVFSFGFSQTGMITNDGMGVWLNASVMNIDSDVNDFLDPGYTLGFGYMIDMGIELSLNYWVDFYGGGSDFNPIDLGATYHMKGDGLSWKFGLRMTDFGDDSDNDNTGNHIVLGGYTDSMMWFTLDHNLDYDDTFFDSPFIPGETAISFGQMWSLDSISFGASYTAATDELDMGWLGLTIGTLF